MKKPKFFIILAIIAMSLNFLSCDNEPIDPALLLENPDTAPEVCAPASLLSVSDFVDATKVNLIWDGDGDAWQIQYGLEGFALGSGTGITASGNATTVTGLDATKDYDFYIRKVCSATDFSEWIGPVSVGTVVVNECPIPSNLTATRNAANATTAAVTWSSTGDAATWEIQYGVAGFTIGSGQIVSSTTVTKQITGLLANTAYDFYVRTLCSSTSLSTWAGPVHIEVAGTPVTGSYWPMAVNNQWVYELNGNAQEPLKIISMNTVSGNSYYTFQTPANAGYAGIQRIRKSGGNYYMRVETLTIPASGPLPSATITGNETIVLKDDIPVGQSWTETYVQTTTYSGLPSIENNNTVTCTILEKGTSVAVNGVTYPDIIKMKRVLHSTGVGTDSTITSIYWYAKNIGPVKIETGDNTQDLLSYILN